MEIETIKITTAERSYLQWLLERDMERYTKLLSSDDISEEHMKEYKESYERSFEYAKQLRKKLLSR